MKPSLLVLSLVTASSVAAADTTSYAVASTAGSIASAATFTAIDLIERPTSKVYGGVELGVNAVLGASQLYLAATISIERDESSSVNYLCAGLGLWNLALAVHGGYVMLHDEARPAPGLAFELGSARGVVAAAVLTDGPHAAAGASLTGTF